MFVLKLPAPPFGYDEIVWIEKVGCPGLEVYRSGVEL